MKYINVILLIMLFLLCNNMELLLGVDYGELD